MEGTKPKSIFDIQQRAPRSASAVREQKPIVVDEPPPPPKRIIRRKKKKKIKVAKAGGVEVSQKFNVKGQRQITLKHKGGLTQNITIHTGKQKPRGVEAKGQTASWNMKPAKFKASRGLRDDRVYLQPPKREYFGNRYQSAIQKLMIEQKIKEAGASKNKEIADVRETLSREKRELERREKSKELTILELEKQRAGLVASHNIAVRNQSTATLLGGDVGELNKLIQRRGVSVIQRLVQKGEITDASTIYQLNLKQNEMEGLVKELEAGRAEYIKGGNVVYLTPTGVRQTGKVEKETDRFVFVVLPDGRRARVPKSLIQKPEQLERERRSRSRSVSVVEDEPPPSPSPRGRWTTARRKDLEYAGETKFDEPQKKSPTQKARDIAGFVRQTLKLKETELVGGATETETQSLLAEPEVFEELLAGSPPAGLGEEEEEEELGERDISATETETETEDERLQRQQRRAEFLEQTKTPQPTLSVVEEEKEKEEEEPPSRKPIGRKLGQRIPKKYNEREFADILGRIPEVLNLEKTEVLPKGIEYDRFTTEQYRIFQSALDRRRGVIELKRTESEERLKSIRASRALKQLRQTKSREVEPQPQPEPEKQSSSEGESPFTAGEIVNLSAAEVRERGRKDKSTTILVDNRPESQNKDGTRPSVKVNVSDLKATYRSIYGADSKKYESAMKKLERKEFKEFYINDANILEQFFG